MQCVRIEKLGPWGNQAAPNWSMQLDEHETIKEVTIRHGFIVDGIGFTVSDGCGKTFTEWFGGQGGKADKIILKANEYILQVSGTHAEYEHDGGTRHISSITIHTNLRRTGYGPYGMQRGTKNTMYFSSPVTLVGIISGFFGRKNHEYLDSIGLYVNKQEVYKFEPWGNQSPTNRNSKMDDCETVKEQQVQKFGPWGSQFLTNWNLVMDDCETIKEVTIRSGFIIDAIGFTIADRYGRITTKSFGGSGGSIHKIKLKPKEYITKISGTHGVYVCTGQRHISSIRIFTNLYPAGYGPYGIVRATGNICYFSSSLPKGCPISGFFGRSDQYLDSIGVYMKKNGC